MKDQAFNGKDSISVIDFLAERNRAPDPSRIHEGATVWLFREFMSGFRPCRYQGWLSLTGNDANRHESTITRYDRVVNHLIRRYTREAVIAKSDEDIRNLKQGSFTPWDFFQKL